jgi:uncharacterized caspase-like protein
MVKPLRFLPLVCATLALPLAAEDRVLRLTQPAKVAAAEQRVALVIGNGQYKDSPLLNPVNDARAIGEALARAGFRVVQKENVGRAEMQLALRDFGDALKGGGVGLFYFAGHGVQVKGRNFLIPIDASIEREDEVAYNGIDANQVLDKMEAASNRLNIVILDACRNNPFDRPGLSGERRAGKERPVYAAPAQGHAAPRGQDRGRVQGRARRRTPRFQRQAGALGKHLARG